MMAGEVRPSAAISACMSFAALLGELVECDQYRAARSASCNCSSNPFKIKRLLTRISNRSNPSATNIS